MAQKIAQVGQLALKPRRSDHVGATSHDGRMSVMVIVAVMMTIQITIRIQLCWMTIEQYTFAGIIISSLGAAKSLCLVAAGEKKD